MKRYLLILFYSFFTTYSIVFATKYTLIAQGLLKGDGDSSHTLVPSWLGAIVWVGACLVVCSSGAFAKKKEEK